MNRLILIGNGFDLAHSMKTSYKDFILDYLSSSFEIASNNLEYIDDIITVMNNHKRSYLEKLKNDSNFCTWSIEDFYNYVKNKRGYNNVTSSIISSDYNYNRSRKTPDYEYTLTIKSNFLLKLLEQCKNYNWVDVENEYYQLLCDLSTKKDGLKEIEQLNKEFQNIQDLLHDYLDKVEQDYVNENSLYFRKDILSKQLTDNLYNDDSKPESVLFLNFNYTVTIKDYFPEIQKITPNSSIINIHGELKNKDNPIIFGYGDEDDVTNFKLIEKYDECLKYVKTYWYLRTNNYQKLMDFVSSNDYEVYIMGHSCGLSDKTLLSEIFNNENCRKIKALTYQKRKNEDLNINSTDYIDKTYQIGRIFKNKGDMRKKLVPFNSNDILKIMYDRNAKLLSSI